MICIQNASPKTIEKFIYQNTPDPGIRDLHLSNNRILKEKVSRGGDDRGDDREESIIEDMM